MILVSTMMQRPTLQLPSQDFGARARRLRKRLLANTP